MDHILRTRSYCICSQPALWPLGRGYYPPCQTSHFTDIEAEDLCLPAAHPGHSAERSKAWAPSTRSAVLPYMAKATGRQAVGQGVPQRVERQGQGTMPGGESRGRTKSPGLIKGRD